MTDIATTIQKLAAEIEAEEKEAAIVEGFAPISAEALELIERYREVKRLMKPYEAELGAIKELVKDEMREKGANKLTLEGVVVVEDVITHKRKIDIQGILRKFPMAVRFVTEEPGTRFDVKK